MDLHRTPLKDFILPKLKSVFVVDYYEGLRGLLETREEFPYKTVFARPRLRSKTDIVWSTDIFSSKPSTLDRLNGYEKERYAGILYRQLQAVNDLIETLRTEEGGLPPSELLTRAISHVDEKSVYCGDGRVAIVNWGLIPRLPGPEGACIFRSGNFNSGWEQTYVPAPEEPDVDTPTGEEINVTAPDKSVDPDEQEEVGGSQADQAETVTPEVPEKVESDDDGKVDETPEVQDEVTETKEDSDSSDSDEEEADEEPEEKKEEHKKDEDKPQKDTPKGEQYRWKDFFGHTWQGLKFLLKKLWWLLVAVVLVLAALFLCRDCQGPIHKVNPFYNPLPDDPVIMPIEEGGVTVSENGLYKVANDRLNILLEKKGDDTMLEWAKAFKNHYSSEDYEVKYYNEDLYTLQIKVPADKRVEVMHEINDVIDGFKFDCFEESVYESSFAMSDPALDDPKASWYLDAIDAYSAWEITQGSEDVVVAVVDNGFDLYHPEFIGKIVSPYNVLTKDDNVRPIKTKYTDAAEHGTHVAATAVGNADNGTGLCGIAPRCKLMPIQVANDNPEGYMAGNMAVLEGILYAIQNGADVVNASIGIKPTKEVKAMTEWQQLNLIANSFKQEEELWNRIAALAKERNCILVQSAGNDNIIAGYDPNKRNTSTIKVSAVSPEIRKASFSNYGVYPELQKDYSTVSAPGQEIYSAIPGGKYMYSEGTSMASPIVAGAVALLKSVDKNITAEQAIRIFHNTGNYIDPSIGPLIQLGRAVAAAAGNDKTVAPADTLKYDDVVNNPRALDGTWKATTELFSTADNTAIELFMTFINLDGKLTIRNKGFEFTAPLKAQIDNGRIRITQSAPATAPGANSNFSAYTYTCTEDREGNLKCLAKNAINQVEFNLLRIK